MSRTAALLGNSIWIVLSAATLLYPCLPARDPNGEFFALSRFDFAFLYLASPETLWLQWTAGMPVDFWAVRLESIGIASVWLMIFGLVGSGLVATSNRTTNKKGRLADFGTSRIFWWSFRLVLGFSCLHGFFMLQRILLQQTTVLGTLLGLSAFAMGVIYLQLRSRKKETSLPDVARERAQEHDPDKTLDQAWKRRLFGLTTIGCVLLSVIHATGSLVPSVDEQVREERWIPSVHLYEQTIASKQSTSDRAQSPYNQEQKSSRFSPPFADQIDAIVMVSLEAMRVDVRSCIAPPNNAIDGRGISAIYPTLLANKLIFSIAGISGLLLIWEQARRVSGLLPATTMLFLLLATPSLLELGRTGRMEWIATTQLAAIVVVLSQNDSFSRIQKSFVVILLLLPITDWLLSLGTTHAVVEANRTETLLRFLGLSTLFSIPWAGCLLIGIFTKKTGQHLLLLVTGGGLFGVLGLIGNFPDRSWIPVLSLFALPVTGGVAWLLERQNRFFGLTVWFGILVASLANSVYWPLLENRILAPIGWLVTESWRDYDGLQESVRTRYPLEFRKQLSEGTISSDSKILLVGTLDDLDIPLRCIALSATRALDGESVLNVIQQTQTTHVGLVSERESILAEQGFDGEENEKGWRVLLDSLIEQGKLKRLPVSAECFDLTLYEILH